MEHVQFEVIDGLAHVRLNRPQAHNALSPEAVRLLAGVWRAIECSSAIRVVVLTGNGKSFCAGMDLKRTDAGLGWRDGASQDEWSAGAGERRRIAYVPPSDLTKPIIAAIQGACMGGGLELALHADIRLAAHGATFALPESSRGLIAGSGGLYFLPRLVGIGRACEMAIAGRRINAAEALEWRLVDRLVQEDDLEQAAIELGLAIARQAPLAVQASKEAIRRTLGSSLDEAMAVYENLNRTLRFTDDVAEGARAFTEKREPRFRGR